MIPVTILTGFLGSGKTTLLKRILTEAHGMKISVIENEFGEENIDNEILVHENTEQIVQMSNGCICCTIRGDLVRTLLDLNRQRDQGKFLFDRVIIETTGLANPGPVAQTFFVDDEIAETYRLDAIITLVDAKYGHQHLDQNEVVQRQIGFADSLFITKGDLVSVDVLSDLKYRLTQMNPRAPQQLVNFGRADLKNIFDIHGFNLNDKLNIDSEFLATDGCEYAHCDHPHHDDAIKSFVFCSERAFNRSKLEDFLRSVLQKYGDCLLRYKGILNMDGIDHQIVFQGVHQLMGTDVGRPWQGGETPNTKMVFIGVNLPKAMILEGLERCLT
ncbi:CobW family GTP-binding protein [Candidatus Pandoraea novymonadis]|uniref:GTP-binding protein YjiA n=1 Tax=Candidatus Pandoraea novymonadis TaxID=1808959 RepID=A0ABX5FDU3_9BURK|nr:GTP-binding protein [Candidatus Pandoraea novymonadis]PSB91633.1 putative GTP-binding protein YjiA [Candidatus Pandoraea novymonadis]